MEPEIGATPHYYDGWHLAKWLGNELRNWRVDREVEDPSMECHRTRSRFQH
ncbi:hypothetical protein V3C99_004478 [Haemonchus contortus]